MDEFLIKVLTPEVLLVIFFVVIPGIFFLALYFALELEKKSDKREVERLIDEEGMTREEAEREVRRAIDNRQSYESQSSKELSYLETLRIKGESNVLHVSPEAIILYENMTGKEMSYAESLAVRGDAKLYGLSDTAVVLKKYGR